MLRIRAALRSAAIAGVLITLVFSSTSAQQQRGDTIIRVATRPVRAGVATLVPEISIGAFDGADEYMFGEVNEIAVARDGSIYMFDRQVPALRKYDVNGKFVKTFGRKGQGPGEYTSGGGLGVLPDGRVLLWDTGNWRINVYSPAGDVLTTWSTPSGLGPNTTTTTSRAMTIDTAGFIYLRRNIRSAAVRGQETPPTSRIVLIQFRPDGTVVDTIDAPAFSRTGRTLTASLNTATSRASSSTPLPFDPQPTWALSPLGYFVTGIPDRYAFELLIPAGSAVPRSPGDWRRGQPVISIRREVKPEAVSGAERKAERERVEALLRRTDPKWNWNGPDLPDVKPLYRNLIAAQDGRIWLTRVVESGRGSGAPGTTFSTMERSVGSGGGGGRPPGGARPQTPSPADTRAAEPPRPGLYDVFEPNGTFVGQVQVPPRTQLMVRRGDNAWGVVYDDDDVATVKRFRIVWR
jgi:hypothetical protein